MLQLSRAFLPFAICVLMMPVLVGAAVAPDAANKEDCTEFRGQCAYGTCCIKTAGGMACSTAQRGIVGKVCDTIGNGGYPVKGKCVSYGICRADNFSNSEGKQEDVTGQLTPGKAQELSGMTGTQPTTPADQLTWHPGDVPTSLNLPLGGQQSILDGIVSPDGQTGPFSGTGARFDYFTQMFSPSMFSENLGTELNGTNFEGATFVGGDVSQLQTPVNGIVVDTSGNTGPLVSGQSTFNNQGIPFADAKPWYQQAFTEVKTAFANGVQSLSELGQDAWDTWAGDTIQYGVPTELEEGYSPYLAAQRAKLMAELDTNQALFKKVAAVIAREVADGPGAQAVLESMVNRCAMTRGCTSLNQMINNGFYGPVNTGQVGRDLQRGLSDYTIEVARDVIQEVRSGSNICNFCTDQGLKSEIRGAKWQIEGDYDGEYFGHMYGSPTWANTQARLAATYDAAYAQSNTTPSWFSADNSIDFSQTVTAYFENSATGGLIPGSQEIFQGGSYIADNGFPDVNNSFSASDWNHIGWQEMAEYGRVFDAQSDSLSDVERQWAEIWDRPYDLASGLGEDLVPTFIPDTTATEAKIAQLQSRIDVAEQQRIASERALMAAYHADSPQSVPERTFERESLFENGHRDLLANSQDNLAALDVAKTEAQLELIAQTDGTDSLQAQTLREQLEMQQMHLADLQTKRDDEWEKAVTAWADDKKYTADQLKSAVLNGERTLEQRIGPDWRVADPLTLSVSEQQLISSYQKNSELLARYDAGTLQLTAESPKSSLWEQVTSCFGWCGGSAPDTVLADASPQIEMGEINWSSMDLSPSEYDMYAKAMDTGYLGLAGENVPPEGQGITTEVAETPDAGTSGTDAVAQAQKIAEEQGKAAAQQIQEKVEALRAQADKALADATLAKEKLGFEKERLADATELKGDLDAAKKNLSAVQRALKIANATGQEQDVRAALEKVDTDALESAAESPVFTPGQRKELTDLVTAINERAERMEDLYEKYGNGAAGQLKTMASRAIGNTDKAIGIVEGTLNKEWPIGEIQKDINAYQKMADVATKVATTAQLEYQTAWRSAELMYERYPEYMPDSVEQPAAKIVESAPGFGFYNYPDDYSEPFVPNQLASYDQKIPTPEFGYMSSEPIETRQPTTAKLESPITLTSLRTGLMYEGLSDTGIPINNSPVEVGLSPSGLFGLGESAGFSLRMFEPGGYLSVGLGETEAIGVGDGTSPIVTGSLGTGSTGDEPTTPKTGVTPGNLLTTGLTTPGGQQDIAYTGKVDTAIGKTDPSKQVTVSTPPSGQQPPPGGQVTNPSTGGSPSGSTQGSGGDFMGMLQKMLPMLSTFMQQQNQQGSKGGNQQCPQPQQKPTTGCENGTWRESVSGSCITGWQCVVAAPEVKKPILALVANPNVITAGATSTISWASVNWTDPSDVSCVLVDENDEDWGEGGAIGTLSVGGFTSSTAFLLACASNTQEPISKEILITVQ